jgi:hypothetical protein
LPTAPLARRARARAKARASTRKEIEPRTTHMAITRSRPSDTGKTRARRSLRRCENCMPLLLRSSLGACAVCENLGVRGSVLSVPVCKVMAECMCELTAAGVGVVRDPRRSAVES